MNKAMSLALLAIGVVLLVYGVNASNSVGSGFSRIFTGSPSYKTLWLLIGGAAALVAGVAGLFRGTKS
jgi:hypothetical protein